MITDTMSSREELLQQTIDRFWETIPPLWNRVRSHIRATATEEFGISLEQFHILRHVSHGINSVSDLATERSISRPAVSQVVDVLVQKNLLTRQQSAADRRCVKLALTDSGAALLKAIFDTNHTWMVGKLALMGQDDLSVTIQAMETLKRTFAEMID